MRRKLINPANALRVQPTAAMVNRIMRRIDVCAETGCWLWRGRLDGNGYGQIKVDGQARGVHRVSFALFKRPIKPGREIDHNENFCRNHACCNPAHLRESSKHANSSRGACRRKYPRDDIPF